MKGCKKIVSCLAVVGLAFGLLAMPALGKSKKAAKDSEAASKKESKKEKAAKATSAEASASTSNSSSSSDQAASPKAKKAAKGKTEANEEATFQPPPSKGMVWANENTKVFHREGNRWYGKTKNGKYMTEADAIKAGYHEAKKGGGSKSKQ